LHYLLVFFSTIGLILTLGLTIYGVATFGQGEMADNDLRGINLKVILLA
jgi:hypothetical protein